MKSGSKKFLHLSVTNELHKALRIRAAKMGITMTDLIKQIVIEHLKKGK